MIDTREGDPLIADLSHPDVPVLRAAHGTGAWKPQQVHPSLAAFIAAITLKDPKPLPAYEHPQPDPRDASLTVLDGGPHRADIIETLVARHASLYQPPMFERKVTTPVVLTRRMTRWSAEQVQHIIAGFGGSSEIGAAIERPR